MWNQIKKWSVEQVLWAEKNLNGKNGKEKKEAVLAKLDELIVLPPYLEGIDNAVLSWLVDSVCDKLNDSCGHDFGLKNISVSQEQEIADEIADPEIGRE